MTTGETPILARRNYVEVVTRKSKKGREARPEEKLCAHLTPAIHADGMDKGRLVKVCADPTCKIHFGDTATGRKTAAPMEGRKDRRKPKGETDARVPAPPSGRRAQAGKAAVRNRGATHGGAVCLALAVARTGVPPCQTPRLAKSRKTLTIGKWPRKRGRFTRRRTRLALAVLIFEAMLIGPAGSATANKDDDPLTDAASLYKSRYEGVARRRCQSRARRKRRRRTKRPRKKERTAPKAKTARK